MGYGLITLLAQFLCHQSYHIGLGFLVVVQDAVGGRLSNILAKDGAFAGKLNEILQTFHALGIRAVKVYLFGM